MHAATLITPLCAIGPGRPAVSAGRQANPAKKLSRIRSETALTTSAPSCVGQCVREGLCQRCVDHLHDSVCDRRDIRIAGTMELKPLSTGPRILHRDASYSAARALSRATQHAQNDWCHR